MSDIYKVRFYDKAVNLVREKGRVSLSDIQREFGINYYNASQIISDMQDNGIVSKPDDKGIRTVL